MPLWLVSAIVGAVCGGLGAGAGYLVERMGFKWGRFLAIVGIGLGLALSRTDFIQGMFGA